VAARRHSPVAGAILGLGIAGGFLVACWWSWSHLAKTSQEFLDATSTTLGWLLSLVAIAAAVFSWHQRGEIRRFLRQLFAAKQFHQVGREIGEIREGPEGMVIPVGTNTILLRWILKHIQPQEVALVYTPESALAAEEVVQEFAPKGIRFNPSAGEIHRRSGAVNAFDIVSARDSVRAHLERFERRGLAKERILVDTTSGTVPMSLGCFQAAEEEDVASIYVLSRHGGRIEDPSDLDAGNPIYMSNPHAERE